MFRRERDTRREGDLPLGLVCPSSVAVAEDVAGLFGGVLVWVGCGVDCVGFAGASVLVEDVFICAGEPWCACAAALGECCLVCKWSCCGVELCCAERGRVDGVVFLDDSGDDAGCDEGECCWYFLLVFVGWAS